jgi:hypothetical protein
MIKVQKKWRGGGKQRRLDNDVIDTAETIAQILVS